MTPLSHHRRRSRPAIRCRSRIVQRLHGQRQRGASDARVQRVVNKDVTIDAEELRACVARVHILVGSG